MKKFFLILFIIASGLLAGFSQPADFTMTSTDGVTYNLYDELDSGKIVVLDFFNTTCPSCQMNTPTLNDIWENTLEYGTYGWVWGIETSYQGDSAIDAFFDEYGGSFPGFSIIEDDTVLNDSLGYEVPFTPYYYVICPNKRIHQASIEEIAGYIEECGLSNSISGKANWDRVHFRSRPGGFAIENLPAYAGVRRFQLIDLTGRIITSGKFTGNSFSHRYTNNSGGLRLLRIMHNGNSVYTHKFVVH